MMNCCLCLFSARSDTMAVSTCCSSLAAFYIAQFLQIRSVLWFEHELFGAHKNWDFQEAERYMNKNSVMLHVWILAHLKIQEMKLSSSNFAGKGVTDLSGALPLFWHYFIIPDNLPFFFSVSGLLFPWAYFRLCPPRQHMGHSDSPEDI